RPRLLLHFDLHRGPPPFPLAATGLSRAPPSAAPGARACCAALGRARMDLFAPYLWITAIAVLMGLAGLSMLLGRGGERDPRGRRRFRLRPVRRLVGLLVAALAAVSALLAMSIFQFLRLAGDEPVALVEL